MKQKAVDISLKWLGDKPDADTIENTIAVMNRFGVQKLRFKECEEAVRVSTSPGIVDIKKRDAFFTALELLYPDLSATRGIEIKLPPEFKEDTVFELHG